LVRSPTHYQQSGAKLQQSSILFDRAMNHELRNCSSFLASNVTYSCYNPFPNCTIPGGFDLKTLASITVVINNSCPSDSRLYPGYKFPSITNDACRIFSGGNEWRKYPTDEAWGRVIAWKFALYQLAALFPRPPLRFIVELFVLAHLMGDPITTLRDILVKFETCQQRGTMWKKFLASEKITWRFLGLGGKGKPSAHDDRLWMALAAISDAYGEWGPDIREETENLIRALMLVLLSNVQSSLNY
jgi:hypothetical protein